MNAGALTLSFAAAAASSAAPPESRLLSGTNGAAFTADAGTKLTDDAMSGLAGAAFHPLVPGPLLFVPPTPRFVPWGPLDVRQWHGASWRASRASRCAARRRAPSICRSA